MCHIIISNDKYLNNFKDIYANLQKEEINLTQAYNMNDQFIYLILFLWYYVEINVNINVPFAHTSPSNCDYYHYNQ